MVLKGLNRRSFEMKLMSNIRRRTARFGKFRIYSKQSTIYVEPAEETCDLPGAYAACKQVFGIIAIARAVPCPKEKEAILATAKTYLGEALTAAQRYGTLELAKIENMRTQAADLAAGRKAQSTDDLDAIEAELEQAEQAEVPAEKRYGFLAVCAGDGLAAAFRDLGVDRVVSGGQTMNPSTEAILREVNHTPSEIVFVLPNNKNIVMAAQQCVGLTEKQVIVVPTHSIPQGISAMMSVDTAEEDPQAILAAMTEAAAAVTTAQITYAARNSDFDGFAINEGDYLALLDGKLFGTERDITSLLTRLAALAAEREAAFVTLFYGEGVSQEEAEAAQALFTEACPETEISLLSGGQPVYYYTISIE